MRMRPAKPPEAIRPEARTHEVDEYQPSGGELSKLMKESRLTIRVFLVGIDEGQAIDIRIVPQTDCA